MTMKRADLAVPELSNIVTIAPVTPAPVGVRTRPEMVTWAAVGARLPIAQSEKSEMSFAEAVFALMFKTLCTRVGDDPLHL